MRAVATRQPSILETLETRLNFSGSVPVGGPVASILSDLFISDATNSSIEIYNGLDGSVVGDGVLSGAGGLADPRGAAFGPDDNLYVASGGTNQILRFSGATGTFIDVFTNLGSLSPTAIEFGPDGKLYVAGTDGGSGRIQRVDPFTGVLGDVFAQAGSFPFDMEFGPDGNLYFTDEVGTDQVVRRVGPGGAELGGAGLGSVLVTIPNSAAVGIAIDPTGDLYVGDDSNNSIKRFTSEGVFISEFVGGGTSPLSNTEDIDFGADGHLYAISSGEVLEFSEVDGSFIGTLVANGSGGLAGPSFMLFAPSFDQPAQDAEFVDIDIVWRDDVAVNVGTLGNDEVRIIAPNGSLITGQFQSVDNGTNGSPRVATYRVSAPGGFWGAEDNGFYRVESLGGGVADTSANSSGNRVLGRLLVSLEHQTPTFDLQGSQLTVIGTDGIDLFSSFGNTSSIAVTVVTPATGSIFTKNFVGAGSADFLTGAGTDQISIDFGVAIHTYKVDAGVSSTSDLDQLTVITGAAGNTTTSLANNTISGAFGSVETIGVEHFTLSIQGGGNHNVFSQSDFIGGTSTVTVTSSNSASNSLFIFGDNTPVSTLVTSSEIKVESQSTTELEFNQVLTDGVGGVNGLNFSQGIAQSPDGRHVYVTSVIDQSVALFERDTDTGDLTFVTTFVNNTGGITNMTSPLAIAVSPDGKHVYVGSQGTNALIVFERNEVVGSLSFVATHVDGTEGITGMDGIQHVSISPDGKHLYVSGSTSNSVAVFLRDAVSGKLSFVQAVTDGVNGADGLQDVVRTIVSNDGLNLYTAANGEGAVGVFARDPATGKLAFVQVLADGGTGGNFLANVNALALDPTGSHLIAGAFVDSAITVFARNSGTGQLTFAQVLSEGVGGVNGITGVNDVVISPDGSRVYVVGHQADSVVTFSRDTGSGVLAQADRAADGINGFQGLDGVRAAIVSPDGKQVYAVSFTDASLVGMRTRFELAVNHSTFATLQVGTGSGDDSATVFTDGLSTEVGLSLGAGNDQVQINDTNGTDVVLVDGPTIDFNGQVIAPVNVEKVTLGMFGDGTDQITINLPQTVASQEFQVNGSANGIDTLTINGPNTAQSYDLTAGGVFIGETDAQELLFLEAEFDSIAMDAPQSVAASPDGHHVYVAGADSNTIAIFERDTASGTLTFRSFIQDGIGGVDGLQGVSHVAVSPNSTRVYAASRFESKVSVFDRDSGNGELTQVQIVEDGVGGVDGLQGVNQVEISPDGEFLVATGRSENKIAVFSINSAGQLTFIQGLPIIGPRGLDFSSDGKFLYVTSVENDSIVVFEQLAGGTLTQVQSIPNSGSVNNSLNDPFDVVVSPDGNNVYVASDLSDSVTVFNRNQSDGTLTFVEALIEGVGATTGIHSASALEISPDGRKVFVAGTLSSAVVTFDRSPSGTLTFGEAKIDEVNGVDGLNGSRFLAMSSDGRQLYAVGEFEDAVAVFALGDQVPILHAGMENLLVQAGDGDDDIFLNDSTEGGTVFVTVLGGQGNDELLVGGEGGSLLLDGQGGNDKIGSGSAGDTLRGGPGDDILISSAANNIMDGGPDNDTYEFLNNFGNHTVGDASGIDTFNFNAGIPTTTVLQVQIGVDTLTIVSNGKTITSGDPIENIIGGTNNDTFTFDDGAILAGGTGTIDGGPGEDALDYTAYTTAVNVNLPGGTATGLSSVINVENAVGVGAGGAPTATLDPTFFQLFVSSQNNDKILRYSAGDGSFLSQFPNAVGVPQASTFGPDGNFYVASAGTTDVRRFNVLTGAFIDVFANFAFSPAGITFGPDGNLYVSRSVFGGDIQRFDGQTGAFIDVFAANANLTVPSGLTFGPDGDLYVVSNGNDSVVRFNGTNGAFIDVFVASGSGGINDPVDLTFGPDNNLYVTSFTSDSVVRYDGGSGAFIDVFAAGGPLDTPQGLRFGPDGDLYVARKIGNEVLRFDGQTGAFINDFVLPGSGGLDAPTFLTFTPLTVNEGDTQFTIDVVLKDDGTINQTTIEGTDFELSRNDSGPGIVGASVLVNVISPGEVVVSVTFNAPGAIAQDSRGPLSVHIVGVIEDDQANAIPPGVIGQFDLNVLTTPATPQLFGPTPYLSEADSPFSGTPFDYFHLEDFTDGLLNTPGVSANQGTVFTTANFFTDSVDGDDGIIDGSGSQEGSFGVVAGAVTLVFTFDEGVLGSLPTHAGLAWTDGLSNPTRFKAFDASNNLLVDTGNINLPNSGQTQDVTSGEDVFFGVTFAGGIKRIEISETNSIEIDHLQYGFETVFEVFTVTNTSDSGAGSLRDAIIAANAASGKAKIEFNIPDTDANFIDVDDSISGGDPDEDAFRIRPLTALPALTNPLGIVIDGTSQDLFSAPSFDSPLGPSIILDGQFTGGDGLTLASNKNEIIGLSIGLFAGGNGIVINGDDNLVVASHIGVNAAGTGGAGNGLDGILISAGSSGNLIGRATGFDRTIIGNNGQNGIHITGAGANANVIENVQIGINELLGSVDLGNFAAGVLINNGASGNIVGGGLANEGNVISFNGTAGVAILTNADGNFVLGNLIGTNILGTQPAANTGPGVLIADGSSNNTIGGDNAAGLNERNVISGNLDAGVFIADPGSTGNVVAGNFIGTDQFQISAVANQGGGIRIEDATSNIIGGAAAGEGNVIAGNQSFGVLITELGTDGNDVLGNFIGLTSGFNALPNDGPGVQIANGASDNAIGDGSVAGGNTIAFNNGAGVLISGNASDRNSIRANNVILNAGLGIDLNANGTPEVNDALDVDTGANEGTNFPVLTLAEAGLSSTRVVGTFSGLPNTAYDLDFFSSSQQDPSGFGEGVSFIFTLQTTTDPSGNAAFDTTLGFPTITADDFVTATATDSQGNTSEFSLALAASDPTSNTFTVTNTNNSGAGSLRQAITDANAASGAATIEFNILNTDPNFTDTDSAIAGGDAGADVFVINLASSLPPLANILGTSILGGSQTGFGGDTNALGPEIVLNGVGSIAFGLQFNSDGNTVRGLVIENFTSAGIFLVNRDSNVIAGNYIGVDPSGTLDAGNGGGVSISDGSSNIIGGMNIADRNIISGNGIGIEIGGITSTGNQILNNFIGTNAAGNAVLGNDVEGVFINGGFANIIGAPMAGNVIGGNGGNGSIVINFNTAVGNVIQANFIGTDATGTLNLGNTFSGIFLTDCDNTVIGGVSAGEGNVIAFNGNHGVHVIDANASGVSIRGNQIFSNGLLGIEMGNDLVTANDPGDADSGANGRQNFPVITMAQSGTGHIVGTLNSTASTTFQIDFFANNAADASGFGEGQTFIGSSQVTTNGSGNATIDSFFAAAFTTGQFITATATDSAGNTSEFSQAVAAAASNVFTVTNTNNTGAGSLRQAITDANAASGAATIVFNIPNTDPNFINTDGAILGGDTGADAYRITLTSLLPTLTNPNGITIDGGTQTSFGGDTNALGPEIIINGGTTLTEALVMTSNGNAILGLVVENFTSNYIRITNGNLNIVAGNYIGTDASGTLDRGGASSTGVIVFGSSNIIGGPTASDRNIISGLNRGIQVGGTGTDNEILNNFIGTDRTGNFDLGNALEGILLNGGVNTRIGAPGSGNVIAGNNGIGIVLINTGTNGTIIQANAIGTNLSLASAIPNGADGINVGASVGTLIGGALASEGNTIAFNASSGIDVFNGLASATTIRNNQIFSNGGLGIDLFSDGVTLNDAGDADSGANALQNFPVISLVESGAVRIVGTLNSTPNTTFDIDFYLNTSADPSGFGEGEIVIDSIQVTTDGGGNAAFDVNFAAGVAPGEFVTATATNVATGNTSEFSQAVAATSPGLFYLGPTPYLQASDSPFFGTAFSSFFLENFEDGLLNTTGLSANIGSVFNPGAFEDGVDGDDGSIDGTSLAGRSFGVSSGGVTIDFSFNETALGGLPTHAGVVWTDGQGSPVTFEAFDGEGGSLGVFGPFTLTISGVQGNTAEDRFFGVEFADGISKIRIRDLGGAGLEVDHVQYGIAGAANTFVVTNTNDSGAGSLRDAIIAANAVLTSSQILFQIPSIDPNFIDTDSAIAGGDAGADVYVINLLSELPALNVEDGIIIDGLSQENFGGNTNALGPEIVLSGISAGAGAAGVRILGRNNEVLALNIQNFNGAGVVIDGGDDNHVRASYIGTDPTGTLARPNLIGVEIIGASTTSNNVIGGSGSSQGNLISGNTNAGVRIAGAGVGSNFVFGNLIGTDRLGNAALANGFGVEILGGAHDNFIGDSTSNHRNTISGNTGDGVFIQDINSNANTVENNFIGVNAAGTAALANGGNGVSLFNTAGNIIGQGGSGPGNIISGNLGHGILLDNAAGNIIDGNNIGTLMDGTAGPGNALNGVRLTNGSSLNQIGTNTPQGGNVIAGNGQDGVVIFLSNSNTVNHNRIGLLEGDAVFANGGDGVLILSSSNNVVGGPSIDFADAADEFENAGNPTSREDGSTWRFGSATSQAGTITTFTTPFTNTNVNGWTFAGGSFGNPPFVARNATASTQTPSGFVIGAGEFAMHPGASSLAVAEWTNPTEDIYTLIAEFKDGRSGPGATVDVHVLVNGVSIFDFDLSGFGSSIKTPSLLMDLNAGDKVRFVVGNGGNGQASDPVIVDARIMRASGNLISGNAGAGIAINGVGSSDNKVQGNLIGTDETGTLDRGNTGIAGIVIDTEANNNVIGGNDADGFGVGNLISGNSGAGVLMANSQTSGNRVQGNLIGSTMFRDAALPNGGDGVVITSFASGNFIGGSSAGAGNVIFGNNLSGVEISNSATANRVQGNLIGTNFGGSTGLGNGERGVHIFNADGNFVGTDGDGVGDASEGNVVSGNTLEGVGISGPSSTGNVVAGNLIGTNKAGTAAVGNGERGVAIFGGASNNRIGTDGNGVSDTAERNIISGNLFEGVIVEGSGTDNNIIAGNFIGTDVTGLIDLGNLASGVFIDNQAGNTIIGGALAAQRNVISGNQFHGIQLGDASATVILGNLIGTNVNGTAAIANGINGIMVNGGATSTTIGNGTTGGRNIISGNTVRGVEINGSGTDNNTIRGNFIGTNITGTAAVGNGENGVLISGGAANNVVGGSGAGQGNVISGNALVGVQIASSSANSILGNIIGLNAAGTAALANGESGVLINFASMNNAVGNGAASGRNIISGNALMGVQIANAGTTNNVVDGNFIGTNQAGTADLGNGQVGVLINFGATNNRIGELNGNVISGNNLIGVQIADGGTSGNTVKANIIGLSATGDADITDAILGIEISFGATNNTIGGPNAGDRNIISGHELHGVRVLSASTGGNVIEGNFIGTDINGTADRGNLFDGVQIQDGPSNVVRGNLISGNNEDGIDIGAAVGTTIVGNLIGTDITGTLDLGNGAAGVRLVGSSATTVGGPNAVDRNTISGNNIAGVMIQSNATNNDVLGNFIGTNQAGTGAIGNTFDGIQIFGGANGNTIGGLSAGEGNVISGNLQDGIEINGAGADNNNLFGNLIGLNAVGTGALGNGQDGVRLFNSDNNDLTSNAISANGRDGVLIDGGSTGNILSANKIGTDFAGALDRGNVRNGVRIDASPTNTIGGATAGSPGTGLGNVISGNGNAGITIKGATATGNSILGNVIGANETGTVAIPNAADGIYIAGAPNNGIGGPGNGNLISGNIGNGINIGGSASTNNNVQGNFIGTNLAGDAALPNTTNGIFVGDDGARATDPVAGYASGNFIGGASVSARNIISGNGTFGYTTNSAGLAGTGNSIHGNFIGTDLSGVTDVPNGLGGVLLQAQNNRLGGANPGEGNLISGNDGPGVTLATTAANGNQIFGNLIGVAFTRADALPNNGPGVLAHAIGTAAINNAIGGILAGEGNTIAFNQGPGVGVAGNATRIAVRGNSIFSNMGLGIDLELNGVTNNDLDDPDAGSNNRQNFPVLTAAVQGSTIVTGSLNARPSTVHQLDFYSNNISESGLRQGRVFIGSAQVTTNAGGDADFIATLPVTTAAGDFITVTATDANGNTSEFSADVAVSQDTTAPTATLTSAPAVTAAGGTTYTFTVTYEDEAALLNSTIGANDVEVHGPNSFAAIATLVSKSTAANAASIVATYRITAPGGSFNSADNGTYNVILFNDAVTDLAGNGTAGATLGQFTVAIGIPTGNASTPNVNAGGESTYRFTVTYADPDGIDPATFDGGDVIVNGPLGFTTGVTFIGADRLTRGTPRTATYEFTAPGGFLDAADNGGYQVVIQPDQVSDGRGAFVPSSTAGNFSINIDSSKPLVSQINIASIRNQLASLTFSVTYSDDVSINLSTLDDFDIRVAGPGGFNRRATLIGVSGSGASVVASYAISPVSGPFTHLNNGSYQVFLEANQVQDDSGNIAVGKLLTTFRVKISSQTPT